MSNAIDEMIQDACNEVREEARQELQEAREGGLKALVSSLCHFINDFDHLLDAIQANEAYADVTPEQVRKYYHN